MNLKFDLLRPFLRWVRPAAFPYSLQALVLAFLAFLFLVGYGHTGAGWPGSRAEYLKILRKTNLCTLVVWGIWWPGLVMTTALFGRLWCLICPLELLSNLSRRLGRLFGFRGVALPRLLREGLFVLATYLLLQILVALASLHRVPDYTSWLLAGLVVSALFVGFLFQDLRAYCKSFCPAAFLLDAYSRFSPWGLINRSDKVCQGCQTKDCVAEKNRLRFNRRSCPSLALPFRRRPDDDCTLCLQCAKVCPYENIGFGWIERGKGHRAFRPLRIGVAIFVFVVSGFVAHEIFDENEAFDHAFHYPYLQVAEVLGLEGKAKRGAETVYYLFGLPFALTGAVFLATRRWDRTSDRFIAAMQVLSPVVVAGHASKALAKFTTWVTFLPVSLEDLAGQETARAIATAEFTPPARLIARPVVGAIGLLVLVLGVLTALKLAKKWAERDGKPSLSGVLLSFLFATLYAAAVCGFLLTR